MKKKTVGVIGCGKWGKNIIRELKKISYVKFIYDSKNNYHNCEKKIDWVFILTPDITHYKIARYFIKNNINVFCEKPLTTKINQAENLINLSKRYKTKLYIDDIENYKKKKIIIKNKINYIIRTKLDSGNAKSLLDRLAYHDFYLLSKYINLKNIKLIKTVTKKKLLDFEIIFKNNQEFRFYYDISSNIRRHLINKINLDKFNNNPIKDMLNTILYKKNNFRVNNLTALKCIKLIDVINKKIDY